MIHEKNEIDFLQIEMHDKLKLMNLIEKYLKVRQKSLAFFLEKNKYFTIIFSKKLLKKYFYVKKIPCFTS
jgi:hypothetical protein